MHTYAINSDKRVKVILIMILISIIITPGFNFFLNKIASFFSNTDVLKNIIETIDFYGYQTVFSFIYIWDYLFFI